MSLVFPDVAEVDFLTDLLSNGENFSLKLFQNDVTPAEGDTAATYTEANFTNYSAKTLNRTVGAGAWATPTTSSGTTSSSYNAGSPQSWTCGATGNTVRGYYMVGATSGRLRCVERFSADKPLSQDDSLTLVPRIELA